MTRLKRHGIRAFVIFGNHDAANTMTKRLSLPDNVVVFSADRPETHYFDAGEIKIALHGQSFKEKRMVNPTYRRVVGGSVTHPQAARADGKLGVMWPLRSSGSAECGYFASFTEFAAHVGGRGHAPARRNR